MFTQVELDAERWLPVVGFDGYEVSDLGRVRSWRPPNGKGKAKHPRVMNPARDHNGYQHVTLRKDKKKHTVSVHTMVLEAFVCVKQDGLMCCHFPDATRTNNRLSNLRWGTHADNTNDREIHGNTVRGENHYARREPWRSARGERINTHKLTASHVKLARFLHVVHEAPCRALAGWFGVSQPAMKAILSGAHWKHVPMQEAA